MKWIGGVGGLLFMHRNVTTPGKGHGILLTGSRDDEAVKLVYLENGVVETLVVGRYGVGPVYGFFPGEFVVLFPGFH